jgi:hypothetical protein
MASISLTFTGTTQALTDFADTAARGLGYQPTVDGQANPQTAQQFLKEHVKRNLMDASRGQRERDRVAALTPQADLDIT